MQKELIIELRNHNVYYIRTEVINYYISIPKTPIETNISFELKTKMSNFDLDQNDEIWVKENVKNTFSFIDDYNITLVLPVLKNNDISILEKIDSESYGRIDQLLSYTINNSFNILKESNMKIANQVLLINNDRYKSFIIWFTTRYQGRIIVKNLLELIQMYNANATPYKKLETSVMNFVVGSYNTEVDAPKKEMQSEVSIPIKEEPIKQASGGFVSYWVLAITTIVIAGIVAYIAFKY